MSQVDEEFETEFETDPNVGTDSSPVSLEDRMQARAEELQQETTEVFKLPGWETVLAVEMRRLGFKVIRGIQRRLEKEERNRTTRELYLMCDQILRATVRLHEVMPDGSTRPIRDNWVQLAERINNAPRNMTPRQALLFLVNDQRIYFLVADWGSWSKSGQETEDEEVMEDFGGDQVTMLAHNCAVLGIQADTWRLFTGENPHYQMWLHMVMEQVDQTKRDAAS